jgi:hypothetical protein
MGKIHGKYMGIGISLLYLDDINGHATGTDETWRYLPFFSGLSFRPKFQGISPQITIETI